MKIITDILADKAMKPADKTVRLSELVLDGTINIEEMIAFAATAKDPVKGTCIETLEYATRANANCLPAIAMDFVISNLGAKAPRVKWESAKVIANAIHIFPEKTESAVAALLINTEDGGTVVRWAAAFALGQIILLKTSINATLVPAIHAIMEREEKNSIKKVYFAALKKVAK
jgi:hypothetical protein